MSDEVVPTEVAAPKKKGRPKGRSIRSSQVLDDCDYKLRSSLLATSQVQPVSSHLTPWCLGVVCRIVPGQETAWLGTVEAILNPIHPHSHELKVCRRYFVKGGKLLFGWYLEIEYTKPAQLEDSTIILCDVLSTARPSLVTDAPIVNKPPAPKKDGVPPNAPVDDDKSQELEAPKVVSRGRMDDGTNYMEESVPLPHTSGGWNLPNSKGKGVLRLEDKPAILRNKGA